MNDYLKKITSLISKEIVSGLSSQDKETLDKWLNEDKNNILVYKRTKDPDNYHLWYKFRKSSNDPAWEKIYKVVNKQKRILIAQKILIAAASILFLALSGSGLYYYLFKNTPKDTIENYQVANINPGTGKALLILDGGQSILLDSPGDLTITEKDGTVIHKADKKLDYSVKDVNKNASLIYNTVKIPRGAEYDLVLSDGTRVFLNSLSELRYPVRFEANRRQVELKGEAYFNVSPSETPFIVKTDQVNIRVLGTEFNVNAYENTGRVVTTLVEGKVRIAVKKDTSKNIVLLPDEQAVYNLTETGIDVKKVDVSHYTAWKDGEIIFQDMRLEDIMITLTRWYSAEVFYMNPSVKDLRFSGSLDRYRDITQIIDIIESTKKVRIEVNGKAILFSERI